MKNDESFMTNLTKFYIVTLLCEGPRHGYDIIAELGKRLGKKPSAGQIYPMMKKLQKLGYVTQSVKTEGGKQRKMYKLTGRGRAFASEMLEKFSRVLDMAVRRKLVECAHCGCEIYNGTHWEKMKGKRLPFCCASCAKTFMRM